MRLLCMVIVLSAGAIQGIAGQERRAPVQPLYRGPLYATRAAEAIEPARGLPVELSAGSFATGGFGNPASLTTTITSRTLRPIPISGITLRAAYGPLQNGMVTFRLRPQPGGGPEALPRLLPNSPPRLQPFVVADEDPTPGIMSMLPSVQVVFTVERIESEEGAPIFENPDATELLWEALGRPTFSQQ